MTRKDLSHNVLEVEHTKGTERWLVVKTTVNPKKVVQTLIFKSHSVASLSGT